MSGCSAIYQPHVVSDRSGKGGWQESNPFLAYLRETPSGSGPDLNLARNWKMSKIETSRKSKPNIPLDSLDQGKFKSASHFWKRQVLPPQSWPANFGSGPSGSVSGFSGFLVLAETLICKFPAIRSSKIFDEYTIGILERGRICQWRLQARIPSIKKTLIFEPPVEPKTLILLFPANHCSDLENSRCLGFS